MKEVKTRFYEFGEFRLDARERTLSKNGEAISVNFKSFDVLLALIQSNGRLVQKDELMRQVWADAIVEETNLKNCVFMLRKALGDTPNQSRYIQTLPKLGYKFVAPVTVLSDDKAEWIVERHTLTEVVIEEQDVAFYTPDAPEKATPNEPAIAIAEIQGATDTERPPVRSRDFAATEALKVEAAAADQNTPTRSRLLSPRKQTLAVVAILLLLGIGALVIYKLILVAKPPRALRFDKISMTMMSDVGNGSPVISPDGKYITYSIVNQGSTDLWVKRLDDGHTTQLLPKAVRYIGEISFSKDDSKLYCPIQDEQNLDGALYVIPVSGGRPEKIIDRVSTPASLSPDEKRLAYRRQDPAMGRNMLLTANIDGSDERVILPPSTNRVINGNYWSPTGKTIVMILWLLNEDGSRSWQVAEIPATGGEIKAITQPQKEPITDLSWMPDESGLIMTARESTNSARQLWFVSYPDGNKRKITHDLNDYVYVIATDQGKSIFTNYINFTSTVWVADRQDTSRARRLDLGSGYYHALQWTPDNQILYENNGDIWIMATDGSNSRRLTGNAGVNMVPSMSPDGKVIAFISNRSGRGQVWRIDSEGDFPKQLTDVPNDAANPKFSPDGRWIFYEAWLSSGWTLWKVPVGGGNPIQLTFKDTGAWAISPDGKELAYTFYDELKKHNVVGFKSTAGGEPNRFYEFPGAEGYTITQWNQEGLFCSDKAGTGIFLLPAQGGPLKPVSDFKTDQRIDFSVSPDGRQIAFARINTSTSALLITESK